MTLPADLRARLESDSWASSLGVEYLALEPGYCRVGVSLQRHMVNFQGSPHGGVIFSLADAAFGAACNSHGDDAVALSMTIHYVAAPPPGGRLVAEARERKRGTRTAFYDVTVHTDTGVLIARLQCVAHRSAKSPG
jgi:acyl-CoA thioesterase